MRTAQNLLYFGQSGQRICQEKQSLHCPNAFKIRKDEKNNLLRVKNQVDFKVFLFGLSTGISWQRCKKKMGIDKKNICKCISQSRTKLFRTVTRDV